MSVPAILDSLCAALFAAVPWAVGRVVRDRLPGQLRGLARPLATFVIAASFVVAVVVALGGLGELSRRAIVIALLAAAGGAALLDRLVAPRTSGCGPSLHAGQELVRWPRAALLGFLLSVVSVLLFEVVLRGWREPPMAYDALMYHLVFPAEWIQRGRLALVPTWFAAPANSYFPCNGEASFAYTMLATGDDRLVNLAQLPFLLAGAMALAGIARRCSLSRFTAALAGLLFLASPEAVIQAGSALVDADFAAGFLLVVFFLLEYRATGSPAAALLSGAGLGLMAGTKTLGLVFAALLLPLVALAVRRRLTDLAIMAAGAAPLGGFWYLRNLEGTGNPLFPLTIRLGSLTLLPGAHGREEMLLSRFHMPPMRAAWNAFLRLWGPSFGPGRWGLPMLLILIVAACVFAFPRLLRDARERLVRGYLLLLPALMLVTFTRLNPYNSQYRFLLASLALSLIPLAGAVEGASRARLVFAAAAVFLLVARLSTWGHEGDIRAEVFPFSMVAVIVLSAGAAIAAALVAMMSRSKSRPEPLAPPGTLVPPLVVEIVGGVEVAATLPLALADSTRLNGQGAGGAEGEEAPRTPGAAPTIGGRLTRLLIPAAIVAFVTGLAAFQPLVAMDYLKWVETQRSGDGGARLEASRDEQRAFVWGNIRRERSPLVIAYTGFNQPYPLYGEDLRNRVHYVAVDGRQDYNLHDYLGLVGGRSGLKPVLSYKPAYYRQQPSSEVWLEGIETLGIDLLVVSRFTDWDLEEFGHDAEGFPWEDGWARTRPDRFVPLFRTADLHVYRVVTAGPK